MRHIITISAGLDAPVSLHQRVDGTFAVIYGADVKSDLDLDGAARNLGYSILHSISCLGKLDSGD